MNENVGVCASTGASRVVLFGGDCSRRTLQGGGGRGIQTYIVKKMCFFKGFLYSGVGDNIHDSYSKFPINGLDDCNDNGRLCDGDSWSNDTCTNDQSEVLRTACYILKVDLLSDLFCPPPRVFIPQTIYCYVACYYVQN